jgi:hypothetical protein
VQLRQHEPGPPCTVVEPDAVTSAMRPMNPRLARRWPVEMAAVGRTPVSAPAGQRRSHRVIAPSTRCLPHEGHGRPEPEGDPGDHQGREVSRPAVDLIDWRRRGCGHDGYGFSWPHPEPNSRSREREGEEVGGVEPAGGRAVAHDVGSRRPASRTGAGCRSSVVKIAARGWWATLCGRVAHRDGDLGAGVGQGGRRWPMVTIVCSPGRGGS